MKTIFLATVGILLFVSHASSQQYTVAFYLTDLEEGTVNPENMQIQVNGTNLQLPLLQYRTAEMFFNISSVPSTFQVTFFGTGSCGTGTNHTIYNGTYNTDVGSCLVGGITSVNCPKGGLATAAFLKLPTAPTITNQEDAYCPGESISIGIPEFKPNMNVQVSRAGTSPTSSNWRKVNHSINSMSTTRVNIDDIVNAVGLGTIQIRFSIDDNTVSCYTGHLDPSQTFRFSPIITLSIPPPPPVVDNLYSLKPKCKEGDDGQIIIQGMDFGSGVNPYESVTLNFSVAKCQNEDCSNVLEADNYVETKTINNWRTQGFTINKTRQNLEGGYASLSAGKWIVKVGRSGSSERCEFEGEVEIVDPTEVVVNTTTGSTNLICPGTSEGHIKLTASGGSGGGYTYRVLSSANYVGSSDFPNLTTGAYRIQAKDGLGCESDPKNFPINSHPGVSLQRIDKLLYGGYDVSCRNATDGRITATATGGTGSLGFSYRLSSSTGAFNAFSSGNNHTGLAANTYTIKAEDSNGCIDTDNVTINNAPQFKASLIGTPTSPSCFGSQDGKITLELENQVGTVTYRLNNSGISPDGGTSTNPEFNVGQGPHTFNEVRYTISGKTCLATLSNLSNIPVSQPSQLNYTRTSFTSPTCNGGNDGTLVLTGQGGSGNYEFEIEGETKTGSSVTFTNKKAATYPLIIRDANNRSCSRNNLSVVLPKRTDTLSAEISQTTPLCATTNTGSITVTGLNGSGAYQFALDQGGALTFTEVKNSHTFDNLKGSITYKIIIKDANCEIQRDVYLNDAEPISATWEVQDVKCFGESSGNILLTTSGGTGTYTYQWSDFSGSVGSEKNLESVKAGNYDVRITDSNNCPKNYVNIRVDEPDSLEVISVQSMSETCEGRSDGSVEIILAGGTTPYSYSIDGATHLLNQSVHIDIESGPHTYAVKDKNGCTQSGEFSIGLEEVVLMDVLKEDLLCYQDGHGYIEFSASGGVGPYEYSITNGSGRQNINEFYDLSAGNYELIAYDNTDCPSEVTSVSLIEPEELIGVVDVIQNEACGQSDGAAEISMVGGTGDYVISWRDKNLQDVDPATLKAGVYSVEVLDENNCRWQSSFNIANVPAPSLDYVVEDSSWCGQAIGVATVSVSGGFAPYQFLWDDDLGQTTATATDLEQGNYNVLITDSRNCESQVSVRMQDGQALYLSSKTITASGCAIAEGSIDITIDGGVGPYVYHWPDTVTTESVTYVDQLFPGIYEMQVTDAVACSLDILLEVNSTEAPQIDTLITTSSYCGLPTGQLYTEASGGTGALQIRWLKPGWQHSGPEADSISAGSYLLEVADSKGCRAYRQVEIADDLSVEPELSLVSYDSSACGKAIGQIEVLMSGGDLPYSYEWSEPYLPAIPQVTGLYAGNYSVQATDAKGCQKRLSLSLVDKVDPVLDLINNSPTRCDSFTGAIAVLASRGTGMYQYVWSDDENRTTSTASALPVGNYSVYAMDENGCETNALRIQIKSEVSPAVRTTTLEPLTCYLSDDGIAEVAITNGKKPYVIQWNDPRNQTSARATNLPEGIYTIHVKDDNGCEAMEEVVIDGPDKLAISRMEVGQPVCHGECDGGLLTAAVGGNFPYTYQLSDGNVGATMSGLCPGGYNLLVVDRKGCSVDTTITLNGVARIDLNQPEHVDICGGSTYIADAGEWASYEWSASSGLIGQGRKAELSETGEYYVRVTTFEGCDVYDTLSLEVRNDILEADFLTDSEIVAGDTVILIDISWPVPDAITWMYPDNVVALEENADRIVLIFPDSGSYEIGMDAYSGTCHDYWHNLVTVTLPDEAEEINEGGRLGFKGIIKRFVVYPNPNSGKFTAEIILSHEAPIAVDLSEINYGKIVKSYRKNGSDRYELVFDEQLINGMHYLKLETLGEKRVIKFLVVR